MIKLPFSKNKTYYVVGLGKSNRCAIDALQASEAKVLIWDDNPKNLEGYDLDLVCELAHVPWKKISALVVAPGIPPSHIIVQTAVEKGVDVICDIDLFAQSNPKSKIIGITGTNGKSTVTALIHHILSANAKSQMGGNIGRPVLDLDVNVDYTVLELSSYQLNRTPHLKCDVAILLNITPDHLDWHEGMDHYVESKERILIHASHKIISTDDDYSRDIFERHNSATPISTFEENLPFNPADMPKMKGQHNSQNMLAAYEACRALGVDHDVVITALKKFEGLPHRQYLVRVINGIPYINDSKATNAEASRAALRSFRNIVWILGGKPKDGGLSAIEGDFANVQKAYVYGEAAEDFAKFLSVRGIEVEANNTMDEALRSAHMTAQDLRGEPSGAPTVLLSPACASFDQYKNFEERGEHFVKMVANLSDE